MNKVTTIILVFLLMSFIQIVDAQEDYSFYLQKARQRIAEGDCDGAQRNYRVYKDLAKKTDQSLEQMIAECGSDAPLTSEELKAAGFRFLKQYNLVKINHSDYQEIYIFNVRDDYICFHGSYDEMYYGGKVSKNGLLNGVVVIKDTYGTSLAYICDGKMAFPIVRVRFVDDGYGMSLEEGNCSYGCVVPSWDSYRDDMLCESMRRIFGKDLYSQGVLQSIYYATVDINDLEKAFKMFVRRGNHLMGSWHDDNRSDKLVNEYESN